MAASLILSRCSDSNGKKNVFIKSVLYMFTFNNLNLNFIIFPFAIMWPGDRGPSINRWFSCEFPKKDRITTASKASIADCRTMTLSLSMCQSVYVNSKPKTLSALIRFRCRSKRQFFPIFRSFIRSVGHRFVGSSVTYLFGNIYGIFSRITVIVYLVRQANLFKNILPSQDGLSYDLTAISSLQLSQSSLIFLSIGYDQFNWNELPLDKQTEM